MVSSNLKKYNSKKRLNNEFAQVEMANANIDLNKHSNHKKKDKTHINQRSDAEDAEDADDAEDINEEKDISQLIIDKINISENKKINNSENKKISKTKSDFSDFFERQNQHWEKMLKYKNKSGENSDEAVENEKELINEIYNTEFLKNQSHQASEVRRMSTTNDKENQHFNNSNNNRQSHSQTNSLSHHEYNKMSRMNSSVSFINGTNATNATNCNGFDENFNKDNGEKKSSIISQKM
mmetsp:Transcript_92687/g.200378  ORF Transcript_92687/g.200378 Transcript_92687/m.200378 type:complete len:238 (-) Transcript_92687:104-817(-)